jgi:hypothetical protein
MEMISCSQYSKLRFVEALDKKNLGQKPRSLLTFNPK